MCYIIMPVVAFVLVAFSTLSSIWGLFSMDWIVGPDGGKGLASICGGVKSLETPFSLGELDKLDQNSTDALNVNFCDSWSWSNYTSTLEQVLASMCIVAGGLGVIILIVIFTEVVLRICFKPHPITPRIVALFCILQFLVIGAIDIAYAGKMSFMVPEGYSIGITYYMMIVSVGASFVAAVLMWLAAKSESKHYKKRFARDDAVSVDGSVMSTTTLEKKDNSSSLVV